MKIPWKIALCEDNFDKIYSYLKFGSAVYLDPGLYINFCMRGWEKGGVNGSAMYLDSVPLTYIVAWVGGDEDVHCLVHLALCCCPLVLTEVYTTLGSTL